MSDPLMDWFRGSGGGDGDELYPRIDANLSCEFQRVYYIYADARYILHSALLNEMPPKPDLIAYCVSIP